VVGWRGRASWRPANDGGELLCCCGAHTGEGGAEEMKNGERWTVRAGAGVK